MNSSQAAPQPVTARLEQEAVVVEVDGKRFTEYRFVNRFGKKPYFWPLAGPLSGQSVTTESSEPYPHHNSMWFGCDHINGADFWHHQNPKGKQVSRGPRILVAGGDRIVFEDICDWVPAGGEPVMRDYRRITVSAPDARTRLVDFDVVWQALAKVRITKTNHSLFALRMAPELTVKRGGAMLNDAGARVEKETFGKTSPWMDAYGSRNGVIEGAAIFQHPSNRWFPSPWFTRDYGFFSPTPMYWLPGGAVELAANETIALSYRVVVHAGDEKEADIAARFEAYAGETPSPVAGYVADVLDRHLDGLAAYDYGKPDIDVRAVESIVRSLWGARQKAEVSRRLLPLLADPKTTVTAKHFVCRQLSLIGRAEAVSALAPLLVDADEHLASAACFALARIPDAAATEALRGALPAVRGRTRDAVITALGVRRDRPAVAALIAISRQAAPETRAAVMDALGRIGGEEAARHLLAEAAREPGLADLAGPLLAAAATLDAGSQGELAAALCNAVALKAAGGWHKLAALKGLLRIHPEAAGDLLGKALTSDDRALRQGAIVMLRDTPGDGIARVGAAFLVKAPAEDQVAVLNALAARGERSVAAAVRPLLGSDDAGVSRAACEALGALGDATDVPSLVRLLDRDPGAGRALVRLRGPAVAKALADAVGGAEGATRLALTQVLADRKDEASAATLLPLVKDADEAVRRVALKGLRDSGGNPELQALIDQLSGELGEASERAALETCVAAICRRLAPEGQAGVEVMKALPAARADGKASLLRVLGQIGDEGSLDTLVKATSDPDASIRDAAVRALASWPRESALAPLLEVARGTDSTVHHVLALRGYAELLRRSDQPLIELKPLYDAGKAVARRDEERTALTLDIVGVVVRDLRVESKGKYSVHYGGLREGARWASDRDYVFEQIPAEVRGATYIEVAMQDRVIGGDAFMRFTIEEPADVYVAFDSRCKNVPAWLKGWERLPSAIKPPARTSCTLVLHRKKFAPGTVTLGGSLAPGCGAMYSVAVREAGGR